MIKLDLQRFGGRGGDGSSLSGGGNNGPSQIFNEEDVWSYLIFTAKLVNGLRIDIFGN